MRSEISAHHAPRHGREIQRYARESGYHYLSTVVPPPGKPNPLTHIRARATELGAEVIIAFDLAHVDNQPHLFCDLGYQLETVCPHLVWTPSVPPAAKGAAAL
ncbi:hypothetical protein [Nocardia flavorosea]|uniref:Resolvase-like protein n=1 Tax=Nocardia flavorosea TaxID=53429 RepID=A0A846Y9Y4_9NOCA|nr:hypothetical protein [Nocardia flavorosea]NKY55953.1 hypothetical protein [Nocardia flavorosea]